MAPNVLALLLVALSLAARASAAHVAVLVAGSSGYANYRHHADVCHAQRILSRNGKPLVDVRAHQRDLRASECTGARR